MGSGCYAGSACVVVAVMLVYAPSAPARARSSGLAYLLSQTRTRPSLCLTTCSQKRRNERCCEHPCDVFMCPVGSVNAQ